MWQNRESCFVKESPEVAFCFVNRTVRTKHNRFWRSRFVLEANVFVYLYVVCFVLFPKEQWPGKIFVMLMHFDVTPGVSVYFFIYFFIYFFLFIFFICFIFCFVWEIVSSKQFFLCSVVYKLWSKNENSIIKTDFCSAKS